MKDHIKNALYERIMVEMRGKRSIIQHSTSAILKHHRSEERFVTKQNAQIDSKDSSGQ